MCWRRVSRHERVVSMLRSPMSAAAAGDDSAGSTAAAAPVAVHCWWGIESVDQCVHMRVLRVHALPLHLAASVAVVLQRCHY